MGGGAWCPREMVYREGTEYLEVNLGGLHIVTKVEVQGRFGNGQGREFARKYKLQIWRPGLEHWVTYTDGRGEELLEGNTNTYLAKSSQLSPPVIATRVRFVPYSDHPRTVCMRVELYGCRYLDGLVSYSMPDGDVRGGGGALRDLTYDGSRKDGYLTGGLGQLTDGETGHTNFRVDALGKGRGYEWVGWKNDTRGKKPIEIVFEFDTFRNFSTLHIYANNFFTKDTQVFSHARVLFSAGGKYYHVLPSVDYEYVVDRIFENARNVTINLHNMAGKYVKLQLFFSLRWMMISEVAFDSVPCRCELTEEEPPIPVATERPDMDGLGNETAPSISAQESPSSVLLGGLVALGIILAMIPLAVGVVYYRGRMIKKANKKSPPSPDSGLDAKKVSMKMKDVHINVNLTPMSNGYSRAKGKLYGHVAMDDETMAMYQKPFKGPMHNDGYYTLARDGTPSEIPLKCPLPLDTDDSVDYAVPDMNVTPPPPFSEVYTPPPPVPLTLPPVSLPASRTHREASLPPPVPPLPPPPEQEYYAAPLLCQSSDIQSVTGTVKYSSLDLSKLGNGRQVPEVSRNHIRIIENLGDGAFGSVQLCEAKHIAGNSSGLVTMKSLKTGASEDVKEDFQQEFRTLSQVDDPNIVKLLGVVTSEPIGLIFEYMDYGDLYHFLQRHILEGVGSQSSLGSSMNIGDPPVLSYGALVYIASQIASGMKYLESLSIVHRDLAARNCLVGTELTIKIADFGMSRPLYSRHYYRSNSDNRSLLPIRWMAWESVLQGKFTTKSDVWSFGVTLWEVLTMGRQQPYDKLSDEGVLENLSHCYHGDGTGMMLLPQPSLCPREMYDMMTACWRPNERQRPPFWEILMFLQRKNLGYSLDYFL
ncbi:discoidin domain-containing receptor 2-like [Macrobrachium rosenbergii]|uniref:discoidin domain-containing receptor 2-like n=1 Tax=Macrobrachium rosenbergii TaxID=79674 RepID=UPI0034D5C7DB